MSSDDLQERLLRDLRARGSNIELSEEERYREMFRAARSPAAPVTTRDSRAPRRLLVGGTTAVVLALGTTGVAAAYSGNLPSPIQTLAHHAIGAPEAAPRSPVSGPPVLRAPTPRSTSGPTPDASSSPSGRPTTQPSHQPRPPVPSSGPSARASAKAPRSRAPSAPTTQAGTATAVLTGVTLAGTSHRADVGARVGFSGQLTYSGTPTSRQRVVLQEQIGSRWTPVAHGRADADGSITFTAPSLQRSCRFRLVAGQGSGAVHSAPWRVAMHPLVTANVTASKKEATITVTALGGFGGDGVTLFTRRDGRPVIVGRARLDASGSASFVVTPDKRRMSYTLVLDPTQRHTSARVGVVVRSARGAGGR